MKKIVININDCDYERFKFEAIEEKKDIPSLIKERIFHKSFSESVEEAYSDWLEKELSQALQ